MPEFTEKDYRRALKKVRVKLLNGKIKKEQFDMYIAFIRGKKCGTIACIGGHMAGELGITDTGRALEIMRDAGAKVPGLYRLFYKYPVMKDAAHISRRRAAAAITRVLDGDRRPWKVRTP
jgi:hypothetical protein